MKIVSALLVGSTLISGVIPLSAQPGRHAGQALPLLFTHLARFSAMKDSSLFSLQPETDKTAPMIDEKMVQVCCEKVENDKRRMYYVSARNGKMVMLLKGIYTREALLFFRLSLCNHSHLDYDMDSIHFFIADKAVPRSGFAKAVELKPVYVYGNRKLVRGKKREPTVAALRRFTLPPGKRLLIEVRERNGGRHLQMQADNTILEKARLI